MSQERRPQPQGAQPPPTPGTVIPVYAQSFHAWVQSASQPTIFDEKALKDISHEEFAHAVKMADAAVTPWLSEVGIIVSVADPEAFKQDSYRKIIGVAESIRSLVLTELRKCGDTLRFLEEAIRKGEPIEPDKELVEQVQECAQAIIHANNAPLALLIATNKILGAIQINLPPSLQPTTTQAPMGFVLGR